jgi:hypothetical protein
MIPDIFDTFGERLLPAWRVATDDGSERALAASFSSRG